MRLGRKRASYWAFALVVAPAAALILSVLAGDTSALLLALPAVGTIVLGIVLRRRALEILLAALLSIPAAGLAWFAWFVWNFSQQEWNVP